MSVQKPNTQSETTKRKPKAAVMRAALEQCAEGFIIKPSGAAEIDWEGMAREFYRRMIIAKEALNHVQ